MLSDLSEGWRRLHDRYADLMAGVLAFVAHRFGEARLEDCYRAVLEPYIQERYMVFDTRVTPYPETLRAESLPRDGGDAGASRAARTGDGTLGIEEYDDRWVVSFDPCGSGGRSDARRRDRGHGLPGAGAVRVRRHAGAP